MTRTRHIITKFQGFENTLIGNSIKMNYLRVQWVIYCHKKVQDLTKNDLLKRLEILIRLSN